MDVFAPLRGFSLFLTGMGVGVVSDGRRLLLQQSTSTLRNVWRLWGGVSQSWLSVGVFLSKIRVL